MEPFYRNEYRDQLEELFIEEDYAALDNKKALKLLLLFTMPLQRAMPAAEALLEHFGSFSAVINAGYDEIIEVGGMDRDSAVLVSLVQNLINRTKIESAEKSETLNSYTQAQNYFIPLLRSRRGKSLMCVSLGKDTKILSCKEIIKNAPRFNQHSISIITDFAKETGAESVIIAYNAENAEDPPDNKTLEFASKLKSALNANGISLNDIIVADKKNAAAYSNDLRLALYL